MSNIALGPAAQLRRRPTLRTAQLHKDQRIIALRLLRASLSPLGGCFPIPGAAIRSCARPTSAERLRLVVYRGAASGPKDKQTRRPDSPSSLTRDFGPGLPPGLGMGGFIVHRTSR